MWRVEWQGTARRHRCHRGIWSYRFGGFGHGPDVLTVQNYHCRHGRQEARSCEAPGRHQDN
ncbi:hypothetical protein FOMG_20025 [Fusarium oxysporum f. sp. melonis 26406]|uniref:Uncharacterized protein n=1 Tax=Fusarium oxysporum f. sp. melonis 26406 TaxID=1089452 RepID=W9YUE7_FUSOX|nr:hypothetical protein FOMG_20025 [Fusarium oxysporum f. sp. melonis 26406]